MRFVSSQQLLHDHGRRFDEIQEAGGEYHPQLGHSMYTDRALSYSARRMILINFLAAWDRRLSHQIRRRQAG